MFFRFGRLNSSHIHLTILLISLFFPPLPIGQFKLFLSDALILMVCFKNLIESKEHFGINLSGVMILGLFAAFLHGYFRPEIISELNFFMRFESGFNLNTSERFNFSRELVHFFRYTSWFYILTVFFKKGNKQEFNKSGVTILLVLGSLHLIEMISPQFENFLSKIYLNSSNGLWVFRHYATFQSPLESAVFSTVLATALFLKETNVQRRILIFSVGALIVIATSSGTPVIALMVGWLFLISKKLNRKMLILVSIVSIGVVIVILISSENIFPMIHLKIANLSWRLALWKHYLHFLNTNWHTLLFGFGFMPIHTDNSYLFFLMRGGLVLFGIFMYLLVSFIRKYWPMWNEQQKFLVIFFMTMGLTLDFIIFRNTVIVMYLFVAPYLAEKKLT